MGIQSNSAVLQSLNVLFGGGVGAQESDRELLERFAIRGDDSAFGALVERHGPMVLGACRAALRDDHDARDAFQAVFLVLVRRARSLWVRDSLGPWLHGVTLRVAACSRASAIRRRSHERKWAERAVRRGDGAGDDDLRRVVHEEIDRLPAAYRVAVIVCDLEGLTHAEASLRLGWPVGTVKSRQARGRERLRGRLARRGLGLGVALEAVLSAETAQAAVPASLMAVRPGMTPAAVGLAEAFLGALTMQRMTRMAVGLVSSFALAAGVGMMVRAGAPDEPGPARVVRADGRDVRKVDKIPRVDTVFAQPEQGHIGRVRPPGAEASKLLEAPTPKSIPVDVSGRAIDTAGRPVVGATVMLLNAWMTNQVLAGSTTDRDGRYAFVGVQAPVTEGVIHGPRSPLLTPYASFRVVATAPSLGLSWSQPQSNYAFAEPFPDDIQGRHPLGEPVTMDLTFRPADALAGRVVDESGRPLRDVELSIHDVDLLDADGHETARNFNGSWGFLPGRLGRAVTDPDGRFRLDALPSEACVWISVKRRDFPRFGDALYAATIEKPVAEHGQPMTHNGRGPHKVASGDIRLTLTTPRRLLVRVVDDATGQPLAGIAVGSLGENMATGVHSEGWSDAEGKLTLELPPGSYRGISGDPPIASRYLRTYRRNVTVAPEPAEQALELRMEAGFELRIEAVDAATGKGLPRAQFWLVPLDETDELKPIKSSTFVSSRSHTGEDGRMRAVLRPEPGRKYRVEYAAILPPNHPEYSFGRPEDQPQFVVEPLVSETFEIVSGKEIRLRFKFSR